VEDTHNRRAVGLNLNVRGLRQSATLAVNARSNALYKEGRRIYKMGLGQSPFPVPTEVVDALTLHASEKDYLPVMGLPALREAVAEFHRKKDRIDAQAEGVLIGPGSKELLFLLQLTFYGELLVPSPSWVSYVPQAKILGRPIRLIPTQYADNWRGTPRQLAAICQEDADRPRLLVLNYPGNPEGGSYSADELQEIAAVARRFGVILLSDEIYGQLHHRGEHVSVARFYPEGTIVSSGLSKWCGAGGWRLGTFTFPPDLAWLMEAMAAVASETYTSVSTPIQFAAVRAFKDGLAIERYLWHVRRILAGLGRRCAESLERAGARVRPPVGAFYLFPDFSPFGERLAERGIQDSASLCERLLEETGVAVLPGVAFQRPAEELTARLAYVNFDGAKALSASETIPLDQPLPNAFFNRWCGDVLEASQRIVEWVATPARHMAAA
jgi:aspartate aminotransferase